MGSGVIYAVIVALWAVVLIPLWLKNHDRSGEARAIERRSDAMGRLFGGRATAVHGDESAEDGEEWHEPTAAEIAAGRRRMVLAVLIGLLVGSVVLVALDVLPMWFVVLPAVLLGGFVLVARQQVQQAARDERRHQERLTRRQAPSAEARPSRYAAVPRSGHAGHGQERRASGQRRSSEEELPEVRRTTRDEMPVAEGWDAVNAPLPTYVSAPRASRVPRVIDLRHTGEWSGEAMVEEARRVREADSFAKDEYRDPRDVVREEMQRALPNDDDAFFDQLAAETRGRGADGRGRAQFFDQDLFGDDSPRAVND